VIFRSVAKNAVDLLRVLLGSLLGPGMNAFAWVIFGRAPFS